MLLINFVLYNSPDPVRCVYSIMRVWPGMRLCDCKCHSVCTSGCSVIRYVLIMHSICGHACDLSVRLHSPQKPKGAHSILVFIVLGYTTDHALKQVPHARLPLRKDWKNMHIHRPIGRGGSGFCNLRVSNF